MQRLEGETDQASRVLCTTLKSFLRLVKLCGSLGEADIATMEQSELDKALDVLIEHNVELPDEFQKALLERACMALIEQADFPNILRIMNPFGEPTAFDAKAPCLSGIAAEIQMKIRTFSDLVFAKLLVDLLKEGPDSRHRVLQYCRAGLDLFMKIDTLEFNLATAKEFADQLLGFKGLIGLLSDPLDITFQVGPLLLRS